MTQPKQISFALVALALYGDLIKRVVPATTALAIVYGAAALVLLAMALTRSRSRAPSVLATLAGVLIVTYVLQFSTAFERTTADALTAATYVCLPLAYLVVIPRLYSQFDLYAMAFYVTLLMIPINAVGLIQQYIDHSFFISTAYVTGTGVSGIVGGVIERNFLSGGGIFRRYPATFVSADRYAGIAMMQLLFSILLLGEPRRTRRKYLWAIASILSALIALFIAGARSRMLIVACALLAGLCALLMGMKRARLRRSLVWASGCMLFLLLGVVAWDGTDAIGAFLRGVPIVRMLDESFQSGDVRNRVSDGILLSLMPDSLSLFGEGLGTVGGGRPGEFGIRVMWIESGLFWTPFILAINGAILWTLLGGALRRIRLGQAAVAPLATAQLLAWIFALLAGLSSTFEIAQALLIFPSIAVLTMRTSSLDRRVSSAVAAKRSILAA